MKPGMGPLRVRAGEDLFRGALICISDATGEFMLMRDGDGGRPWAQALMDIPAGAWTEWYKDGVRLADL